MLKEVVASSMLVMKKEVEPHGRVVGFESVVAVSAITSVDANVVDPRDMDVD